MAMHCSERETVLAYSGHSAAFAQRIFPAFRWLIPERNRNCGDGGSSYQGVGSRLIGESRRLRICDLESSAATFGAFRSVFTSNVKDSAGIDSQALQSESVRPEIHCFGGGSVVDVELHLVSTLPTIVCNGVVRGGCRRIRHNPFLPDTAVNTGRLHEW